MDANWTDRLDWVEYNIFFRYCRLWFVFSAWRLVSHQGWKGYNALTRYGYTREKIVLSTSGDPAHVALPGVHRIASFLKRWLMGTHQGAVSKKHLDYYLDEFTFRFNRRASKARGLLFYRLLQNAVRIGPSSYRKLIAGGQDRGRKPKGKWREQSGYPISLYIFWLAFTTQPVM